MIKFIAKCIIVLLAMQSAMDYLHKEEIIEGSIKINYPAMQLKLIALIPTEKIANRIVEFALNRIRGAIGGAKQTDNWACQHSYNETSPSFKIVYHVINNGETLYHLSQKYKVHWQVIKKLNRIPDEQNLYVGQVLRIPSRKTNRDHYAI